MAFPEHVMCLLCNVMDNWNYHIFHHSESRNKNSWSQKDSSID